MLHQVNQILFDAPLICTTKFTYVKQGGRYIVSVLITPDFTGVLMAWVTGQGDWSPDTGKLTHD